MVMLIQQCCAVTDVLLVDLPNRVGQLAKMADKLAKKKVNVSFVYGSTGAGGRKANVFRVQCLSIELITHGHV